MTNWQENDLQDGEKPFQLKLDRKRDWVPSQAPHLICAGATGSGKTYFLECLLLEARSNGARMTILDPKNATLAENFDNVITDSQEGLAKLIELSDLMQTKQTKHSETVDLIIIDELAALKLDLSSSEQKAFDKALKQIALKGRSANIFLCVGIQQANAGNIPTEVRDQFGCRIQLGYAAQAGLQFLFPDWKGDYHGNLGTGLCSINGETEFFEAPTLEEGLSFKDF